MLKLYLTLYFLLVPSISYAYLDPGTGNAVVYFLITFIGAFLYYVKRVFYKIFFRKKYCGNLKDSDKKVVLFSEGKTYWFTFKPIIEELIAQKIPFKYISTDIDDPGLTIDNPYMDSKYYEISQSSYAKIARYRGKFFIATTPNIGCAGYPLKKPKYIETMIHISHAVSDSSYLKIGSLDHYDVIMDIGNWCEQRLRKIEKIRNLKNKQWFAVGLPYLDELSKNVKLREESSNTSTVLVAPSWGAKSALTTFGTRFIFDILDKGYHLIFRPHPQSWHFDKDLLDVLLSKASKYSNFELDKNVDASVSMQKADILISDSSSFKFDFAFLYKRPVITMHVDNTNLGSFEASLLGGPWDTNYESKLGTVINKNDNAYIPDVIEKLLGSSVDDIKHNISSLYDELIVNHGTSAKHIVEWIKKQGL